MEGESNKCDRICEKSVESQESEFTVDNLDQDMKIEIKQESCDSIPDNSGSIEDFLALQLLDGYPENENNIVKEEEKPRKRQYVRRSPRKRKQKNMLTNKNHISRIPLVEKQNGCVNQPEVHLDRKTTSNRTSSGSGVLCLCPYCRKFTVVDIEHTSTDSEHRPTSTDSEHTFAVTEHADIQHESNLCNGEVPADSSYEGNKNENDKLGNKKEFINQCRYCYQTFVTTVEKGKNKNCFKTSKIKKGVIESSEVSVKKETLEENVESMQTLNGTLNCSNSNSNEGTLALIEKYSSCLSYENMLNTKTQKKSKKAHKCETCNKEFFGKYRLNRHQLTHTGYRPFKCSYCEMRFSVKDKVVKHEKNIHNMDLTYQCSKCDKRFTSDIRRSEHEVTHKDPVKNPLECEICKKTFTRKYKRDRHMNSHTGIRPFKCQFCEKCFYTKDRVTAHEVTHMNNRPLFNCSFCDKIFVTDGGKREHELVKHIGGKPELTCDFCEKTFLSFWKLTRHVRSHTGDRPFKCTYCDKCFGTKYRLNVHVNFHTGERQFKCIRCNLTFLTSRRLREHQTKHPLCLPYTCNYCGSKFTTEVELSAHEKTHYAVLPYLCEFCDKKFATEEELKEHDKKHAVEEQFPCNVCRKLFNNKPSLIAHEKLHDRPGNKCSYCGFSCSNASSLKIHEKRHTGERPFKCRFCDKRYITGNRCRMHEKTHDDENWQYLCCYCGKKFFAKSKVETHEFVHTGLRPHKCEICGVAFNLIGNLTAHYRVHNKMLAPSYKCSFCDFHTPRKSLLSKHLQRHDNENKTEHDYENKTEMFHFLYKFEQV